MTGWRNLQEMQEIRRATSYQRNKNVNTKIVKNYVDKRIKSGHKSKLQGWAMSDILKQVAQDLGRNAVPQARKYIVEEVCSITEY